jgi:HD superfamily phosphohydrolase
MKKIILKDKIYGEEEIKEPVLLELLETSAVLRLKNISQWNIPDKYHFLNGFSRYEHSVGVMILLRRLGGANLEEQISGLVHDVSHPAFSHMIDWINSNEETKNIFDDFQDSIHKEFVLKTKIPYILEKYNFKIDNILDEKRFTLLEKEIPDLCADRVDYILREFKIYIPNILLNCLSSLMNFKQEIVFSDKNSAFDFAVGSLKLQSEHWASQEDALRHFLFSEALKIANKKKIVEKEEFFDKDEKFILCELENTNDEDIKKILNTLKNKNKISESFPKMGKKVFRKFRHVDPKILINNNLKRLSEIDSEFKNKLESSREENKKGLFI